MNYIQARELARKLRQNQTRAEKVFWNGVRKRRLFGLKFYRQYPVKYNLLSGEGSYFIPDFYCHSLKLIVELDGKIHLNQQEYDAEREDILRNMGFSNIRFVNDTVIHNWGLVKIKIEDFITHL